MAHEDPTLRNELPAEYDSEWLVQELARKRNEVMSTWENEKNQQPKESAYYQERIDEWRDASGEEWDYRFFANMAEKLKRETLWRSDEFLEASFKNMPGSDEDRRREIRKWKDLRIAVEKAHLSKADIQAFAFRNPFTKQEMDILGHVYYEMRALGYSGEEFGTFA